MAPQGVLGPSQWGSLLLFPGSSPSVPSIFTAAHYPGLRSLCSNYSELLAFPSVCTSFHIFLTFPTLVSLLGIFFHPFVLGDCFFILPDSTPVFSHLPNFPQAF